MIHHSGSGFQVEQGALRLKPGQGALRLAAGGRHLCRLGTLGQELRRRDLWRRVLVAAGPCADLDRSRLSEEEGILITVVWSRVPT